MRQWWMHTSEGDHQGGALGAAVEVPFTHLDEEYSHTHTYIHTYTKCFGDRLIN
jgi:hypothetical protein